MSENKNMIDRDELSEVARNAECLQMLLNDLMTDFFENFDPDGNEEQTKMLVWEFRRYRLYADICFRLSKQITQDLHTNGVSCYYE